MIDRIADEIFNIPLKKPVNTACAHCGKIFKRILPTYAQMFCSEQCLHDEEVMAAEALLTCKGTLSPVQEQFILRVLEW